MQRVLFIWELGANFGHLTRLIPLAQEQRALGREVLFAVNNLQVSKPLLDSIGFVCVLAPKVVYKRHRRVAANHTELLLNCGYSNQEGLQQTVGEWLTLFERYQPSLLVIDHSPTALLANKISKIPVIQVGSGFEIPPSDGWPNYFSANKVQERNEVQEPHSIQPQITLLSNMNHAIKHHGMPEMQSTVELYGGCHQLLITFQELDHYPTRKQVNYIGPLYSSDEGREMAWSQAKSKKVFIYTWAGLGGLNQMMLALAKLDVEVIARIPDLTDAARMLFTKPNIRIFTEALKLKDLISESDLLITHSGFATVSVFLRQGVPVMVVPDTIEQLMVGQRVQSLGAGLVMGFQRQQSYFEEMIVSLLDMSSFKAKAMQFAQNYKNWHPEHPIKEITWLINSLLLAVTIKPLKILPAKTKY